MIVFWTVTEFLASLLAPGFCLWPMADFGRGSSRVCCRETPTVVS